jgi:nicotinate-nucleotide adenylyltransferase
MRIGIMGGTFNPIHHGHLVAAEVAREEFRLDKVIFVPTYLPPHKSVDEIIPARDRYEMVKIAVSKNPYFEPSDIEVKRGGKSYTHDTLEEFRDIYRGEELYFITGADALREIDTWKNIDELAKFCKFIAVSRPGYPFDLKDRFRGEIYLLEIPALAISSTEIRARIRDGKSIKYLVPEKVEEYIIKNGLYRR